MATASRIGLDIGSMSVRAAETTASKHGPAISNFGQLPLPEGAVVAGVVQDPDVVTAALRELWAGTRFRSRTVVLGVTNPQVVVRPMAVQNLPRHELRRSLPFQVGDALPLPADQSLLDFCPLEDPGSKESVRGLLVAAPKDAVLTAVRATERAKLHVQRVDLASFALLRATSRLDSQVEAIVDIGARSTTVVVHVNGEPLMIRTVPRGGTEVTEQIANRRSTSLAEAEALKCRYGLRPDVGHPAIGVVREAVRPLVSEIRSSFAYVTAGGAQTGVSRLALSGGGSLLPGLPEELSAQLNVDVVVADPVIRLLGLRHVKRGNLEPFRSSAAVSIGLALGGSR
jgi:type IV pilus assembly protein PilM